MSVDLRTDLDLPNPMKDPEYWIQNSLNDLFFLCTMVLSHNKEKEYRDLNDMHLKLCDFVDQERTPWQQKLILIMRDALKSTISRADMIQWFLRKRYRNKPGKVGLFCGRYELGEDSLDRIMQEIYDNELLQSFFHKYLPANKHAGGTFTKEKIRYKGIEIDIGSPDKSLTGHHYEGIINDNLVNEVNSDTYEQRRKIIRRWQQQESMLAENGWEKIYETTWEIDDLSGFILDEGFHFDYTKIRNKVANIFTTESGYKVFSCTAKDAEGNLAFPEKIDEAYLARKRRKQGIYVYSRMYDLQPIPDEEVVLRPEWLSNYEKLPFNFISNMVLDMAGTTRKESSYVGMSIMDWDQNGFGYLNFAEKRKLTPMNAYKWMKEVYKLRERQGRPITFIGVEKEKYGIFLADYVEEEDPDDLYIWEIDIKGRPRHRRIGQLVPLYEQGRILSAKGLRDYEAEYRDYYKGKDVGVDILDTVAYQLDIKTIPVKSAVSEFPANIPDEARQQFQKEFRESRGGRMAEMVQGMF